MGIGLAARAADAAVEADLTHAVVVVRTGDLPNAEKMAATVLVDEVEKRTGIRWATATTEPEAGPAIVITSLDPGKANTVEDRRQEGYRLHVDSSGPDRTVVRITGADGRGALFGAGRLLRTLNWRKGAVSVPSDLDMAVAPAYPIRGHQLGYRHTANSYDAWDAQQYEQYIRELVIFGANTIEAIPFQGSASPVMPLPREEMNLKIAEICEKYDVDHWIWTPAEFDLNDTARRQQELDRHEEFYRNCVRLDAVFFPGGDPGNNHPKLVMPFLKDLAERLRKHHPDAGMWLSLQGFNEEQVDYFYGYIEEHAPPWLAGVVAGPSSPPIPETRKRLPAPYRLRSYPDITHTVLCQYPVPWWDPAFAFTLGREPVNPQPRYYARVHNRYAPYTDGFSTYSDGINDDVNKTVWSALGWDPHADLRQTLIEYARFFFGPDLAEQAADGILALETNWEGGLALNGSVDATFAWWSQLEAQAPQLGRNWRWRLHLFRAAYDVFTRHRLLYETRLEREANQVLLEAETRGADAAMDAAMQVLERAETAPCCPQLRARLEADGEALFQLIGFQTSAERYHARNYERGAVLDFLDRPLNNRWWLEDEFVRIRALPSEDEKVARLDLVATWEAPGHGDFYDDIGNVAQSPHVVRGEGVDADPGLEHTPNPDFGTWFDEGRSRLRLSWLSSMDWPVAVVYEALDPLADYVVRLTGKGDALLRVNGERVEPARYGTGRGEFKEFPVPRHLLAQGTIRLTWDVPDESGKNWRDCSILTEVWLLRNETS